MGLFGPKKSAEEKAFGKALDKAFGLKEKRIVPLMEATAAYPAGWQGYWITALYYDIAPSKELTPDPVKAQEYFLKAEAAARGTDGEAWLNNFMTWYRRPAGNLLKPIEESLEKVRRLGVALMNCYQYKTPVVGAPAGRKDDAGPFAGLVVGAACSREGALDYEYNAFMDLFNGFQNVTLYKDHGAQVDALNAIIKKYNKANDAYDECMKAIKKGKNPPWHKLCDMYAYMLGHCCIDVGPFITDELASQWGMSSEGALGICFYLNAARNGNQPAIHELVRLANASKSNYNIMSSVFRGVNPGYNGDLELYLLEKLLKCIEKGDEEAGRLMEVYYAEKVKTWTSEN